MSPRAPKPAKDKALDLLGYRARSRGELERRLRQAGYGPEEIGPALDDLERVGLVDDEEFARQMAAHQVDGRGSGRRAAVGALRQAGIGAELAERAYEEAGGGEDDAARAEELARRRLGRLGSLDEATAYRRLLGFLQRRGYDGETSRTAARRALGSSEGE